MQDFLVDMVEERIVRGNLRWLANFKEIRRDYRIGEFTVPLYASGGLEERGFFLSRVFSALVTPKYRVHLVLQLSDEFDARSLRRLIISCKEKFGDDDWVFIGLVQEKPIDQSLEDAVGHLGDQRVGVATYSLDSQEEISSDNVLGRALRRQLKLTEVKFEAFDLPSYIKSFAIAFLLGVMILMLLLFLGTNLISPLGLLVVTAFSIIVGYRIYKVRYHMMLTLNHTGFKLAKGKLVKTYKWMEFIDTAIHITPSHETCIRLISKKATVDLPLSRIGLSRRDAFNAFKSIIERK